MSILNRGTDVVTVFAENCQPCVDADGNKLPHASGVGQLVRAVVQPLSSDDSQNMGQETQRKYRLRLVNFPHVLGAQSQVEWRGKRFSIVGDGLEFHSSPRTSHTTYTMVRT